MYLLKTVDDRAHYTVDIVKSYSTNKIFIFNVLKVCFRLHTSGGSQLGCKAAQQPEFFIY